MSAFARGLAGIPLYALSSVAAEVPLLVFHAPGAVQLGVFAVINVSYGAVLGSWWALLVPGVAGLLSLLLLDEPAPIENTDMPSGVFWFGVLVIPATALIVAGVVARKAGGRTGAS